MVTWGAECKDKAKQVAEHTSLTSCSSGEEMKTGFSCLLKTSRLKLKKLKFENIKIRKNEH
jgi:hypothetical protein